MLEITNTADATTTARATIVVAIIIIILAAITDDIAMVGIVWVALWGGRRGRLAEGPVYSGLSAEVNTSLQYFAFYFNLLINVRLFV